MTTADTLLQMYEAMHKRFGHQGWWPATHVHCRRLEVCVGAILTQNTSWKNVLLALANLHAAGAMSVAALAQMPLSRLAELIRPAGYYNVKARRLANFIAHVHAGWGDDIAAFLDRPAAALREELLALNGIGPETADAMVLYAACKPAFVVDAYTVRILARHRLISPDDGYEQVKELFESALPPDVELYSDYHAQLVAVGKAYCKKAAPLCPGCPLDPFPHVTDDSDLL